MTQITVKKNIISNSVRFTREVRAEVRQITWPTRREVMLTTIFVFIFTAVASVFFSIVDAGAYKLVGILIN